jgi:O-antigen/teichoic acid export membrane protein
MLSYLRRLATTGAAYTAASVLSKLIAVALLPIYTQYLSPSDYGAAEVMVVAVIAASIVIRFGVIEALLRFYYVPEEDPDDVVRTGFASLFWTTTLGAAVALLFAEPISEVLLDRPDAELARIAIGGLWVLTLYEYLVALLRVDERARAYFAFTMANTLVAIPVTVWLVVVEDMGAEGLLLGTFGSAVPFLAWLAIDQRRRLALVPDLPLLRRLVRFGLPTMPAELSLYSLNFIDRIIIVRLAGLAEAGLYSLAIKFAQSINVLVRGFQLAWPPLAYSISDDDEARRAYSLIVTWFMVVCTFVVVGMWLLSPWIVRLLAAPEYFEAHEAIGPLTAAMTLYALYLVLVVVLGRTGRTEYNFPATAAATAANIVLNLILVPPYGIVGAAVALVASYLVVLVLMYVFTQRLFPVPYEWGRLALIFGAAAVLIGGGELLLPDDGLLAFAGRVAIWLAFPAVLWVAGFLTREEREAIGRLMSPGEIRRRLRELRERAATEPAAEQGPDEEEDRRARGPRLTREVYEAEARDEDRGNV